jgi:hypothetical protein
MWHLTVESGMVRFVSLFGLAFLTLAAVALMTSPEKPAPRAVPEPDRNDGVPPVFSRVSPRVIPAYTAGFSLN